jgi:hypothetical protein
MECVYLDLGGGDRWNYWKVRCLVENIWLESRPLAKNIPFEIRKSLENIWFEIRKILDISGIIKIGDWDELAGLRPFAHLYLFATFYSIRIDYGVLVCDIL